MKIFFYKIALFGLISEQLNAGIQLIFILRGTIMTFFFKYFFVCFVKVTMVAKRRERCIMSEKRFSDSILNI